MTFLERGRRHAGQIMVLFALALPLIMGFVGMSYDGILWLSLHQRARAVADLAALAGSQCLESPSARTYCTNFTAGTEAVELGRAVAAANGFIHGSGGVTVTVSAPATATCPAGSCIRVDITTSYSTTFFRMANLDSLGVSARAEAGMLSIELDGDDVPLAACGCCMVQSTSVSPLPTPWDILLDNPYRVDSAYFGWWFILQSGQLSQSQSSSQCPSGSSNVRGGGSADWKGKLEAGNDAAASGPIIPPVDMPTEGGNAAAEVQGVCVRTGQIPEGTPVTSWSPTRFGPPNVGTWPTWTYSGYPVGGSNCHIWLGLATRGSGPSSNTGARILNFACFEMFDRESGGGASGDKWLGILRPNSKCPYAPYRTTPPPTTFLPSIFALIT